jgi:hypothetical protein
LKQVNDPTARRATTNAPVTFEGTLLRDDRVGMATGHRPHYRGKHKGHGGTQSTHRNTF